MMFLNKGKRPFNKTFFGITAFIFATVIIFTILPSGGGYMKPLIDAEGNTLDGSLSERVFIDVDDTRLGLIIRAKTQTAPVIMFLGGGPGFPGYFMESLYPTELSSHFIMCYPDYRGTGISFSPDMQADEMTTDRYLRDIHAFTRYLCERFDQEKIYIMGHSFGTGMAIQAVTRNPELYHAYIAVSQVTDVVSQEKMAFVYMRDQFVKKGSNRMVKKMDEYSFLQDEALYESYVASGLRDKAMHTLGVGTTRDMKNVITGIFFPSLRFKAYTQMERINIWRARIRAKHFPVFRDTFYFNAFALVQEISIPIYFFVGAYDYTCSFPEQLRYYEFLKAPVKNIHMFHSSAHSPLYEEPQKAIEILQDIVTLHSLPAEPNSR